MKRGIRKLVSTVLVASMVLTCAATSALAAEPDSVQEFRQGKTKMVSADHAIVALQEDGTLWGWGFTNDGRLGKDIGYDREETSLDITFKYRTYPVKLMTNVIFADTNGNGTSVVKDDGSVWYTGTLAGLDTIGAYITERRYQQDFIKLDDHAKQAYVTDSGIFVINDNNELMFYERKEIQDSGPKVTSLSEVQTEPSVYHFEFAAPKNCLIM